MKAKIWKPRKFLKHQQEAFDSIVLRNLHHVGLFLEMRLGKTLVAIRLVQHWFPSPESPTPCLVVAPVTVLETWERELSLEREPYILCGGLTEELRTMVLQHVFDSPKRIWCLMNYDSVRITPGVALLPWAVALLDESTVIKNPKSKISMLCTLKFRQAKHRMVLSGLPTPEGPLDIFQQLRFLIPTVMGCGDYWHFRAKYFEVHPLTGKWRPKSGMADKIKEATEQISVILRRQDAGLPNVRFREIRTIPMLSDQEEVYRAVEEDFAAWVLNPETETETLHETEYVITKLTWLARIAGGFDIEGNFRWNNKIRELLSLLKGELSGQPVVVGFRFNKEIDQVFQALTEHGIPARKLYAASTNDDDTDSLPERSRRKAVLDWFRNTTHQPQRVLLCQDKVAKYGIDISISDTLIHYSKNYSCEEITQFEDRVYHPLKKSPILIMDLISEDTVDQDVLYAVASKASDAKMFMSSLKESLKKRHLAREQNAT